MRKQIIDKNPWKSSGLCQVAETPVQAEIHHRTSVEWIKIKKDHQDGTGTEIEVDRIEIVDVGTAPAVQAGLQDLHLRPQVAHPGVRAPVQIHLAHVLEIKEVSQFVVFIYPHSLKLEFI